MKKILLACEAGVCTSTMAINKLKTEIEKRDKLKYITLGQCKILEIPSKAADYDLIVATTQVNAKLDIPVIMGMSFLTGIGIKETVDEIEKKLGI